MERKTNAKPKRIRLAPALVVSLSLTETIAALGANDDIEQIAKTLRLTPQQKLQLGPIRQAETPQVNAIKGDMSLSKAQKLERLSELRQRTDPSSPRNPLLATIPKISEDPRKRDCRVCQEATD